MAFSQKLNMACEESFEIVPNKKAKSSVWNHFSFLKETDSRVDKTRVACKLCPVKTILKYSSNTTNLTDHLRRKHSKFLKEQSESTSSDAKAATVKQTTHSSKQFLSTLFSANLNEILIVTLKCHYRNTITIVKMGAIVTPSVSIQQFGKKGQVKPLPKGDDAVCKKAYSPVSVLLAMNNIYERILASQLCNLPFLCRLQAEIPRSENVRLFKSKNQRSRVASSYAGLSLTWHWTCQVHFSSK